MKKIEIFFFFLKRGRKMSNLGLYLDVQLIEVRLDPMIIVWILSVPEKTVQLLEVSNLGGFTVLNLKIV